jgi:hypothetical protein
MHVELVVFANATDFLRLGLTSRSSLDAWGHHGGALVSMDTWLPARLALG